MTMRISGEVAEMINAAITLAEKVHFELITPELFLYVVCQNNIFSQAFENCGGQIKKLADDITAYLNEYMEKGTEDVKKTPEFSKGMELMLTLAWESVQNSGKYVVELMHIIYAMYQLKESDAVYFMRVQGIEHTELIQEMIVLSEEAEEKKKEARKRGREKKAGKNKHILEYEGTNQKEAVEADQEDKNQDAVWQQYAVCLNDELEGVNPLIGREEELERTMQILCRKEKNNPLHIGEPGVGKTAITYGLAKLLNENQVPKPLKGARIFSLDLGSLLAGTQYRGDFEKRFKRVMDSISREENPIIYID